jgi:hypothetical protein
MAGVFFLRAERPRDIVNKVTRLGFREVFHLTPERAQARYFAGRSDKLKAPHFEQLELPFHAADPRGGECRNRSRGGALYKEPLVGTRLCPAAAAS